MYCVSTMYHFPPLSQIQIQIHFPPYHKYKYKFHLVTNRNIFPTLSQQSRAMPSRVWWKHSRRSDQSDCQALNNDNDGNYNDNDDVNDGNDNCNWYLVMIMIMMIINNDL